MATNKKLEFQAEEVELADFAKALAHPARLAILKILAQQRSCICGQIVEGLPLAQPTVSQHLKELKNVGLIKGEIEGKTSCYCINWETYDRCRQLFEAFHLQLESGRGQTQNCC
ncbi:metalloregulator ArsR/SmtB family transcription factor [Rhabdobacter roseus]|uniref:DNA-binding transcriptional ArsR family regulator n=1 Tax=Rhabdobacter roseus TaxID=1655419 RepID=A0A840TTV7_9BACT|nr:metalloregulator ArsR/SmtB family transcription factor [Rhabdobacter roseus]MBB5286704.1 DNA-binding transcriptional ArsR family regulator [Rhabdobacter roseus]